MAQIAKRIMIAQRARIRATQTRKRVIRTWIKNMRGDTRATSMQLIIMRTRKIYPRILKTTKAARRKESMVVRNQANINIITSMASAGTVPS
jgi:hypothetical protein